MCGCTNSKRVSAGSPADTWRAAAHSKYAGAQDHNGVIVNLAMQHRMQCRILSKSAREHIGP